MVMVVILVFAGAARGQQIVTIKSPSSLIELTIMVRAGSVHDPLQKEGLAYLTARTLLEGGFGDPKKPTTKEELAALTRPWGEAARPSARVEKEVTTFYVRVPQDVLDRYLKDILEPLFAKPVFQESELDRIRNETLEKLTGSLRYEDIESLGLHAVDHYIFEGTHYAHLPEGSVTGLKNVKRADLLDFYSTHYRPQNLIVGISKEDGEIIAKVTRALSALGRTGAVPERMETKAAPAAVSGRNVVIVALPNADSTGIHAAFPISVNRTHPDFWPLYIANVFFGTHRDGFSYLYQEIRQKRGYNYGDYSYIEHFAGRPFLLFPPFNTPRKNQYFSIWIRPVAHKYTHHILKALTWELGELVRRGLTAEQVALAKNKAKILYLNLSETVSRLLNARVDDEYYGMGERGYLENYLQNIDAVSVERVNQSIRTHLQSVNMKYVVVTDDEVAERLAEDLAEGKNAFGKAPDEYQIPVVEKDGGRSLVLSPDQLEILQKDAVWNAFPLEFSRERINIVPVERLFETGDFIAQIANR